MDDVDVSEEIARLAQERSLSIAVAESLTGGALSQAFAAAPDASAWFAGGVVAYTTDTKTRVLGVPSGDVVNAPTARRMAEGVRELLGADFAVAVTGVGGPGREEGEPPGTVFLAVAHDGGTRVQHLQLEGEPEVVVARTVQAALAALRAELA